MSLFVQAWGLLMLVCHAVVVAVVCAVLCPLSPALQQSVVYPRKMLELKFVCRTSIAKDTWRVSSPLVFPQLPDNVEDPQLYQTGLQAHRAAPLASLAGSDVQLQVSRHGSFWSLKLEYLKRSQCAGWQTTSG